MKGGISIDVKMTDSVRRELNQIANRLQRPEKVMRVIGTEIVKSVRTNFMIGGRPDRWEPSNNKKGTTLRDTSRLMKSIHAGRPDWYSIPIGTDVQYAAKYHFGFNGIEHVSAHSRVQKGKRVHVKAHSRHVNIPARPFLMVQPEDWDTIIDVLLEYLRGR